MRVTESFGDGDVSQDGDHRHQYDGRSKIPAHIDEIDWFAVDFGPKRRRFQRRQTRSYVAFKM